MKWVIKLHNLLSAHGKICRFAALKLLDLCGRKLNLFLDWLTANVRGQVKSKTQMLPNTWAWFIGVACVSKGEKEMERELELLPFFLLHATCFFCMFFIHQWNLGLKRVYSPQQTYTLAHMLEWKSHTHTYTLEVNRLIGMADFKFSEISVFGHRFFKIYI